MTETKAGVMPALTPTRIMAVMRGKAPVEKYRDLTGKELFEKVVDEVAGGGICKVLRQPALHYAFVMQGVECPLCRTIEEQARLGLASFYEVEIAPGVLNGRDDPVMLYFGLLAHYAGKDEVVQRYLRTQTERVLGWVRGVLLTGVVTG